MTHKDVDKVIAEIAKALKAEYAYKSFPRGYDVQPPYICYYYEDSDDVYADNVNYARIRPIAIEIYTEHTDFEAYKIAESILGKNGMAWSDYDVDIPEESMVEKIYETEVILNG